MKLLKPRTFIIFALAGLSGVALLHTSQNVQRAEDRLKTLKASIDREEEQIRMLKAEWVHLNRPERLEQLAEEFLDLVPPSSNKILREADGMFPDLGTGTEEKTPPAQPVSFVAPLTPSSDRASGSTTKPPVKPPVKPKAKPAIKPSALSAAAKKAPKDFNTVLEELSKNAQKPEGQGQ